MKAWIVPIVLLLASPAAAQVTVDTARTAVPEWIVDPLTGMPIGTLVNPTNETARGGAFIATSQVNVTTSATLIVSARPGRQRVILSVGAANACAFGPAGITMSTGFPLQPVAGATLAIDTVAAVYAACSATTTVSALEQY